MPHDEPANFGAAEAAVPSKSLADLQLDLLADLYDDELLNDCYQQLMTGAVAEGMKVLVPGLCERRSDSSDREWEQFVQLCRLHPIRELLHQDPFTLRVYQQGNQRGRQQGRQQGKDPAVDPQVLDFIHDTDAGHGPPKGTSELGRKIFEGTTQLPVCEGFRIRARRVAETVDHLALEIPRPSILSVTSGHLREVDLTGALRQERLGRWVAQDSDTDSLREIQRRYGEYGVETVAGTVGQLLEQRLDVGEFDFIYSMGLFDHIDQSTGKRLTARLFDLLRPGGQILIANFLPEIEGRGYLESFMDWRLICRSHPDLLDLAMSIDQARIKDIQLLAEDVPNILFLRIRNK